MRNVLSGGAGATPKQALLVIVIRVSRPVVITGGIMKHTGAMRHAAKLGTAWCVAAALVATALAQDVPGIEVCTRESRMDRRTGCLQSNVEFLQQVVAKNALDAQQKLSAASRDIAALKEQLAAANRDVTAL